MAHPKDIPIEQWTPGWLRMECANLLDRPDYILMHDHEKRAAGLPVTGQEMIRFVQARRAGAS